MYKEGLLLLKSNKSWAYAEFSIRGNTRYFYLLKMVFGTSDFKEYIV
jgi:hypothetical protein